MRGAITEAAQIVEQIGSIIDRVEGTPDYSGRAAILSRERPGAFLVPSRPPPISS